ncbi:Nn.00g051850.m01.CDS01 [Neocucurbitaria sp. VM-36]
MPPTQLHHPSPKRKREQAPPIPLLNTALRPASPPPRGSPAPPSGADSPRNAVADQLRGMTLIPLAAIPMSPLTPTDDVSHKKPKLDDMRVDSGMSLHGDFAKAKPTSGQTGNRMDAMAGMRSMEPREEIPETPQASQPRILPDIASFAQPTTFTSSSASTTSQQISSINPRPRTQNTSSSQPRQRNKSPSLPPSALTWHDSEITGHLVDPSTDPDDDGTGLNGIGFKPTPAIAYARSQKRRQQLNEWKARQTREERAKRSERRRRGVGGTASREATVEREMPRKEVDTTRRTVKFAI